MTDDLNGFGIRVRSAVVPAFDERSICSTRYAGSLEKKVIRIGKDRFAVRRAEAQTALACASARA